MSALRFHELTVKRVSPEAAGSVAITFNIPPAELERFHFEPGQFLTVKAVVDGQEVRRSYSISSPRSRLAKKGELEIGIRPVEGGVFSNWAAQSVKAGDTLSVMPPLAVVSSSSTVDDSTSGRTCMRAVQPVRSIGVCAGSGPFHVRRLRNVAPW